MKDKSKVQRYLSSNEQFRIIIDPDFNGVVQLFATNYESSFYDLASTIYNDCINHLNFRNNFQSK